MIDVGERKPARTSLSPDQDIGGSRAALSRNLTLATASEVRTRPLLRDESVSRSIPEASSSGPIGTMASQLIAPGNCSGPEMKVIALSACRTRGARVERELRRAAAAGIRSTRSSWHATPKPRDQHRQNDKTSPDLLWGRDSIFEIQQSPSPAGADGLGMSAIIGGLSIPKPPTWDAKATRSGAPALAAVQRLPPTSSSSKRAAELHPPLCRAGNRPSGVGVIAIRFHHSSSDNDPHVGGARRRKYPHLSIALAQSPAPSVGAADNASATAHMTKVIDQQKPDEWLASKFKGTDVLGVDGTKVGSVDDILFDRNGQVKALSLGSAEFLGDRFQGRRSRVQQLPSHPWQGRQRGSAEARNEQRRYRGKRISPLSPPRPAACHVRAGQHRHGAPPDGAAMTSGRIERPHDDLIVVVLADARTVFGRQLLATATRDDLHLLTALFRYDATVRKSRWGSV